MKRKIAILLMYGIFLLIVETLIILWILYGDASTSTDIPSIIPCKDNNTNTTLDNLDPTPINKNRNEDIAPASTLSASSASNSQSGLNSKPCPSVDTASILANLETKVDITLVDDLKVTVPHEDLLQQTQDLPTSVNNIPNIIQISSLYDFKDNKSISIDELFVLFKTYPSVSYWIFSEIDIALDGSKPSLGDYMQKYNLYMDIKTLALKNSSAGLIQTLLCEERISKHIEVLCIAQIFKNHYGNIDFVLPQMENLKTLMIKKIPTGFLMKLFIKSYKTFMNLDDLTIDSSLGLSALDMYKFASPCLSILNSVKKEISLRRDFLYDILTYVSTKKPNSKINLTLQANMLTLDLSLYFPSQDVTLPNSNLLYSQLKDITNSLFKQNVNEYVFTTSKCFLNHQNISMQQFEDLIVDSYNTVKDNRQKPVIQVEYADVVKANPKKTLV
jgi:hypothetical protein